MPWFGVVGALVGLATAGVYALARLGLPAMPAATVAVAVAVVLTGCFHEDGLASGLAVADALRGRWADEASIHTAQPRAA